DVLFTRDVPFEKKSASNLFRNSKNNILGIKSPVFYASKIKW
ncbi:uncharacterized protein METZ01_LOCUS377957, partial [marine metagenome]